MPASPQSTYTASKPRLRASPPSRGAMKRPASVAEENAPIFSPRSDWWTSATAAMATGRKIPVASPW